VGVGGADVGTMKSPAEPRPATPLRPKEAAFTSPWTTDRAADAGGGGRVYAAAPPPAVADGIFCGNGPDDLFGQDADGSGNTFSSDRGSA